jgi:hypothetical protein
VDVVVGAEGLGIEALRPTLAQGVLQLPEFAEWAVLTHEAAVQEWPAEQAIATYRVEKSASLPGMELLKSAREIYWSSGSQWDAGHSLAPRDALHACGPGKTAAHLRAHGVAVTVFPSNEEWIQWTKN